MVEQIDFYILSTAEYLPFACHLLDKAYVDKHRIHVHTQSQVDAENLNSLLWTFRDTSFIPHQLNYAATHHETPITIGFDQPINNNANILLILAPTLLQEYTQYQRVIFIVPDEAAWKNWARGTYKTLDDQHSNLHVHKV